MLAMMGSFGRWAQLPASLRRTWWAVGLAGAGLLVVVTLATPAGWLPQDAEWLSSLIWLYFWLFAGWHLGQHRVESKGTMAAQFGAGNLLTMARGWLLALLAGFLMGPAPQNFGRWLPMLAYTASDISDYFDGYLSRVQGLSTPLGEALDLELDSLGLLIAVGVVIHFGALPWWFLIFGAARYGYTSLLRIRRALELPVHDLSESKARRPIAGLSMGYVSAALWPILDRPELTLAGVIFLTPFLASFIRDGMVAAGVVDPASPVYQRWRGWARRILLRWLPLLLRLGLISALAIALPQLLTPPESLMVLGLGRAVALLFALILGGTGLAMAMGWAGRFMAFVAVFPLGLTVALDGLTPIRSVLVICILGILMLGTGRGSLWQPSDRVFARRAGEEASRNERMNR